MPLPVQKSKIAIIVVNYTTADLAILAVQSVLDRGHGGHPVEVHLLDNASPTGDAAVFERVYAERGWHDCGVTLWLETVNHGFGRANNVVINALSERADAPDYVFLLNPDAELDNEAAAILADTLDGNPAISAVGASVDRPGSGCVPAAFRFPTAAREFFEATSFGPLTRLWPSSEIALAGTVPRQRVGWVTGAAVMMRLDTLRKTGFFDPDFFLYFEETELMWRLHRNGGEIWYIPEARVNHVAGASTQMQDSRVENKAQPAYWYDSWRLYHVKTRGVQAARLAALAKYIGSGLHVVLRKVRGKQSGLPMAFFRDFRVNALGPLFGSDPFFARPDGKTSTQDWDKTRG